MKRALAKVVTHDHLVFQGEITAKIADTLGWLLFRDTITARMLRMAIGRGTMPQAEFMDEYHRRCARKNPGRSSFANNFARTYSVTGGQWNRQTGRYEYFAKSYDTERPLRVMQQVAMGARNALVWIGPCLASILEGMSDARLQRCFESVEAQFIAPRPTDFEDDTRAVLAWIRNEIDERATRGNARAA